MKNKFNNKSFILFAVIVIILFTILFSLPRSVIADTVDTSNNWGLESIKCKEAQFFTKGSSNVLQINLK